MNSLGAIFLLPCLSLCIWWHGAGDAFGQTNIAPKRILVLYPSDVGSPGNVLFDRAIRDVVGKSIYPRVEVFNEYLDHARFSREDYPRQFARFLQDKYSQKPIDLAIAPLKPSLDFLMKYRELICSGKPILFAAMEKREVVQIPRDAAVHGVPMQFEFAANVELALHLQPNLQRMAVITGDSQYDHVWEAEAKKELQRFEGRIQLEYWSGLTLTELTERIYQLPPHSAVLYLHMFRDRSGNTYVPAIALESLAKNSPVPIFGHIETYLGRGVVGGRMLSFTKEGEQAGQLALGILRGEPPPPLLEPHDTNITLLDWRQLQRFGLDEARAPHQAQMLFREPTLWDSYKWHILALVTLCLIELILIAGLLFQRTNRRKAEGRFHLTVESSPNGILMLDQAGRIVLVNSQAEKLFGYGREELIGKSVEKLVPEQLRSQYLSAHQAYLANPVTRPIGTGRDLFGRRKDGTEIPVEIGLNTIETKTLPHVLVTIVDITQRKHYEGELRASNEELRALAGQLIHAQETERRRIARDLHDDLNQNLAMVSLELDSLGLSTPQDGNHLSERLESVSSRVKQISSWVHVLSHQLHPAKVEQLGLLTALRSLCREIEKTHPLKIEIIAEAIPQTMHTGLALCFYRIAQESLQNILKHSGSARAEIRLQAVDASLNMSIQDFGCGFEMEQNNREAGLGLLGMRERIRLVEGSVSIRSAPGEGTTIEIQAPLEPHSLQPNEREQNVASHG